MRHAETLLASTADTMLAELENWQRAGLIRPLDLALATLLHDRTAAKGEQESGLVLLAAALVSFQVGRGHVCLHLAQLAAEPVRHLALASPPPGQSRNPADQADPGTLLAAVSKIQWLDALGQSSVVESVGSKCASVSQRSGNTPLVLAGERLYLRRYWLYEQTIASGIVNRLAIDSPLEKADSAAAAVLKTAVDQLFGKVPAAADWQRIACCLAARSQFSIVTGGPGTGKTTTVLRLLAVLQTVALSGFLESAPPESAASKALSGLPRIRLAAPTGKAAARLSESISAAIAALDLSGLPHGEVVRAGIPTVVTTLHRLLGSRPDSRAFRHHAANRLQLDVLVIDEASMIDVEMMARVFEAMPDGARLILIGDKDQLSSVDSGAVLGELCQRAAGGHYTQALADWLAVVAGQRPDDAYISEDSTTLDRSVTMLRHTWRFGPGSGIRRLAELVNAGALTRAALMPFQAGEFEDLEVLSASAAGFERMLASHALAGYQSYLERLQSGAPASNSQADADIWAQAILTDFSRFRLLSPLRSGLFGVDQLNALVEKALHRAGLISGTDGWYAGRPLLITRNDYSLGLMNGDVGIALPSTSTSTSTSATGEQATVLRAVFPTERGLRWISPGRLNHVETVFAMTVHKSQGSEFEHACLVLPDKSAPVLTRELVYTGITRAKRRFSLIMPAQDVLLEAARCRVERSSGLGDMLGIESR